MGIIYDDKAKSFTLHTKNTTYQMKVDKEGFLLHLYYGRKTKGNMDYLLTYADRGFSGNPSVYRDERTFSLDALPQEFPSLGNGDYRSPAFVIENEDGTCACDLRYVSHQIKNGKYSLNGLPAVYAKEEEAETLEILMEDPASGLQVVLLYGILEDCDILTRCVKIQNTGKQKVILKKVQSACLDFVSGNYDVISFYGRHAMERNMQRKEAAHGNYVIGSRRGTSSHQYSPVMILAEQDTSEDFGSCYGMNFVYSGGFQAEVEKDQYNQTRMMMGLSPDQFSYPLETGEVFTAPEVILTYSKEGFGKLSENYHQCIREHVCRGKYKKGPRPILVNSWEAAYFDFTGETIYQLAKDAKECGIDMVVMDDGWFGKRNDDNSGLGDWEVNEKKLGCSLQELSDKITKLGVSFGIWIEPEMVNEDSDLYREHPDWAFAIPGRAPVRSRNQLVLDFSRKEVVDYIFEKICAVLDQADISYVKWDMNRSIFDVYSAVAKNQGKVLYDYVLGLYRFLERLITRYPDLLLEGCSGGGGRFDAGMLYYCPQIWCSDNTDAVDRVKIQYGTSFGFPISTVGSHVSAVPNHQTGRTVSLKTRGITAMAGTFGYELNLGKLSEEEKSEIRKQVAIYRKDADLIQNGRYYRLTNPFEAEMGAWSFVSTDRTRALVCGVMLEIHGNMTVTYVKLKGLNPEAFYQEKTSGRIYGGAALMEAGIPLPVASGEYEAYRMDFQIVEEEENGEV